MFGFFTPDVPNVDVNRVKRAVDSHEACVILDVRTPQEFTKAHIKGSINLPVDRIETVEKIVRDKSQTVYVYCLSGSRSVVAVDAMVKRGYTHVYDMQNGLLAWRIKQFPLTA